MNIPFRLPRLLLSASVSLGLSALSLRAQAIYTWTNPEAGNWNEANNWNDGVPVVGGIVTIDNGGTAQLPAGVTGSPGFVKIGTVAGGSGAIEFSGGELTRPLTSFVTLGEQAGSSGRATMNGGHWSTSGLIVGLSGSGTLEMNDGLLESSSSVFIAGSAGASGTATITGGTLQTDTFTLAGAGASGTMIVHGGAIESTHAIIGGGAGSEATATIDGTGNWANSAIMIIGSEGSGTLEIDGGSVQNGTTIIGGSSGGTGSLVMTGGTFTSTGGVTISDDPDVPDDLPNSVGVPALIIGGEGVGAGTMTMNGGQAAISGQMLVGGGAASGAVTVNAGTLSVSDITFVGAGATTGGANTLTIDGNGSFSSSEVQVGYGNASAPDSSATLVVAGGSAVIDGDFALQIDTSGLVVGTGFAVGSLAGAGTFVQSGGSLTTAEAVIGLLGGTGTARISGGTWTNSGTLRVGYSDSAFNATLLGDRDPSSVDLTGTGTLTIEGTGVVSTPTVALATHAGDTGTLNIGAYDLSTTGGTLDATSVVFGNGTGAINFNQTDPVTFGADISGSGSVTQRGSGTTVLTGNATHIGGTTISAGTLQIGDGGSTGSVAGDIVDNGSLVFDRGNLITYDGVISGAGGVTQIGAGVLRFTNDSSYTGDTRISGGSLFLAGGASLSTGSGDLYVGYHGTGALIVQAGASVVTDQVFVGVNAGDVGTISLSDTFTASKLVIGDLGTGTLTLAQNSSLSVGDDTITLGAKTGSTGTLAFGSSGPSGTTSAGTINGGLGGGTVKFDHAGELTLAANLTGNLAVTKIGDGTTILTGTNSYTGATAVNAGTLRAGAAGALPANTAVVVNGGTLDLNGFSLTASSLAGDGGAIALGAATLTVDQSADTDYAGAIGGDGGLIKTGTGSLTLSGTSAYTGITAANGGTLAIAGSLTTGGLGVGRADDSTAAVVVSGTGAELRVEGGSPSFLTVGDSSGSTGTLTVADGGLVSLADGAQLTVGWNGAGTLNLNAGGTIEIGGTADGLQQSATATGSTVNLDGGTLRVGDGFTTTVPLTLANTSTFEAPGAATFSGALTGNGGLVKTGAGTLTLAGTNTYVGGTTVSGGALQLGADGTVLTHIDNHSQLYIGGTTGSIAGDVHLEDGASLAFNHSDDVGFAGAISGAGSLVLNGSGMVTLTGAGTYTGGTVVNFGTLRLGDGGSLGPGDLIMSEGHVSIGGLSYYSSPTLHLNGHAQTVGAISVSGGDSIYLDGGSLTTDSDRDSTFSGFITGAGHFTKAGAGTLTFNGRGDYTGGTTVAGGTLALGDSYNGYSSGSIVGDVLLENGATLAFNLGNVINTEIGFAGAITGAGNLIKLDPFALTLSGTVAYTGATTVEGGILNLTDSAISGGRFLIGGAGAGTLNLTGGTVTGATVRIGVQSTGTGNVTVSGQGVTWTNTGNLIVGDAGTGTLTIKNGAEVTSTSLSEIGALPGGNGQVTVSGLASWTSTGDLVVGNAGTDIFFDDNDVITVVPGSIGTLTLATGGEITLGDGGTGTLTLAANAGSTGTLIVNASSTATRLNAAVVHGGAGTATVQFDDILGDITFAPSLTGKLSVDVSGIAGTLVLTGDNDYTGTTTINDVPLVIDGHVGGNIVNNSGLTLSPNSDYTYADAISGDGSVTKTGPATLTFTGANTYTGGTTIAGGTLDFGRPAALPGTNLTVAPGAVAAFGFGGTDDFTSADIAQLAALGGFQNGAAIGLDTSDATGPVILNVSLANPNGGANALGLVKLGAGTLVLTGTNSYTGGTMIAAGTLALGAAGSLANTSGIDLAAGATLDVSAVSGFTLGAAQTLSGSGSVVGDVSVAGTLAPGHSPGLLTFAGDLTLESTSTLLFQLGGDERGLTYDAIDVGGDLIYAGDIEFSLIDGATLAAGDTFQLFGVEGSHTGAFDSIQFTDPGLMGSFDYATGSLRITAVPEPATGAAILGALVLLVAAGHRRRRGA